MRTTNAREKRFCDAFVELGNAVQAALRAGYAQSTADRASDWINPEGQEKSSSKYKPELREYIDARLEELHNENTATPGELFEYLSSVVRGKSESEIVVVEGTGEGCSAARTVTKRPDEKEKLKAAEILCRMLGLFRDKIDVSGSLPVVITGADKLED